MFTMVTLTDDEGKRVTFNLAHVVAFHEVEKDMTCVILTSMLFNVPASLMNVSSQIQLQLQRIQPNPRG